MIKVPLIYLQLCRDNFPVQSKPEESDQQNQMEIDNDDSDKSPTNISPIIRF